MIMRLWKGKVKAEKAASYLSSLNQTGLKDYAETPGNLAVYSFRRDCGSYVEFLLLTLWESIAAIKRFAGEEYEKARYYPEDDDFLLEKEPFVDHYEVDYAVTTLRETERDAAG